MGAAFGTDLVPDCCAVPFGVISLLPPIRADSENVGRLAVSGSDFRGVLVGILFAGAFGGGCIFNDGRGGGFATGGAPGRGVEAANNSRGV